MLRSAVAASLLFAVAFADCGFPNGTDTKINWWQGPGTGNIKFTSLTPVDKSGNLEYPIALKQPLYIKLHMDNEQGVYQAPSLLMTITLFEYGGWSGCSWSEVPTFGLLDNMDACAHGIPCPVQKGDQDMTAVLDFTKFGQIISLLKDDAPYQLQIKLTDKTTNTYVSILAQARTKTK